MVLKQEAEIELIKVSPKIFETMDSVRVIDPLEKIKTTTSIKKPLPLRHHKKNQPLRKNLKAFVRRQAWQQAGGCCQVKDHHSNLSCKSRVGLKIDYR